MKLQRILAFVLLGIISSSVSFLTYGQELKKDVTFEFVPPKTQVEKGKEISVGVMMHNPTKQAIVSFLTVVQFDNKLLKGVRVEPPQPSLYDINLYANDESAFLQDKGVVRMGRATISDVSTLPDKDLFLGNIVFQVLDTPKAPLVFQFLSNSVLSPESTAANISNKDTVENVVNIPALKPFEVQASASSSNTTSIEPQKPSNDQQKKPVEPVRNVSTEEKQPSIVVEKSNTNFATVAKQPIKETPTDTPLENVPSTPKNGPAEQVIVLLFASIAAAFFLHRYSSFRI